MYERESISRSQLVVNQFLQRKDNRWSLFEDGNVRYKERPPNTTTESAEKVVIVHTHYNFFHQFRH